MKKVSMRERLLASTMIVGAIAVAGAGHAAAQTAQAIQTAPGNSAQPAFGPQTPATIGNSNGQSPASANTVQTVTVTGSLIRRPNLTSAAPVASISQQELKLEGSTDAVNVLDELPQNNAGNFGNSPDPLNGEGGFTQADLRNLGSVRTLVLQDGRRLMPGDPTSAGAAADLDTVPYQLIQSIQVLTGGSSTTYGSDAVAGVINFVMKHDFQGVQLDVQYGAAWHDNDDTAMQKNANNAGFLGAPTGTVYDGQTVTASLIFGSNTADGKGNVEGYLNYRHQDPVTDGQRDYPYCETYSVGTHFVCVGSSNSNYFQNNDTGKVYSVSGNNFVNYGTLPNTPLPGTEFNSDPYEYLQREDERYQGGFFANYKLAPSAELYSEFGFMDDRSQLDTAPSAVFRGANYLVNCDNPFLSAQEVSKICTPGNVTDGNASLTIGRRDVEGGPRISNFEHDDYRAVIGLRGDIIDGWHYDVYGQYGYTKFNYAYSGDLSLARVDNALQVVNVGGVPTCKSVVDGSDPNCVPYNIFQTGGVTPAALNYIKAYGSQSGDTQEQIVHAGINGDLGQYGLKSPFANDGVGVALGTEYRRESLVFQPDQEFTSGDLIGVGGAIPAVSGQFDVYELFGEVDAPLVQDRPFIKLIDFDAAYRFSQYSTAGDVSTYKFALQYRPVADLLLRGSFNRAVRAPNTNELFSPTTITNGNYSDPCAYDPVTKKAATATAAQCVLTGLSAADYGNGSTTDKDIQCASDQCSISTGGNLALKPEQADTVTFGGVFTPKFLPQYFRNLDISIDYFHIDLKNAVSTVAPGTVVNECISGVTSYCGLIHRNLANDSLTTQSVLDGGYTENTELNIGRIKTSGLDFEGNYRYNIADLGYGDFGRLSFNYIGTYTAHFIDVPAPGLGDYDCAGYYGTICAFQPRFSSKLRVSYTSPYKFTLSMQWRYTGPMKLDTNQTNPLLYSGSFDQRDANVSGVSFFDLSGTYQLRDNITLRAGINNFLDRDPPVLSAVQAVPTGQPNTFSNYDLLGRTLFVGLTADF